MSPVGGRGGPSIEIGLTPLRGWAPRGQRIKAKVPHGRWQTMTLMAALRHDRITAPWFIEGPINGEAFLLYIEKVLVPTLRHGDIVIMHNLGSHKANGVRRVIRAAGARGDIYSAMTCIDEVYSAGMYGHACAGIAKRKGAVSHRRGEKRCPYSRCAMWITVGSDRFNGSRSIQNFFWLFPAPLRVPVTIAARRGPDAHEQPWPSAALRIPSRPSRGRTSSRSSCAHAASAFRASRPCGCYPSARST